MALHRPQLDLREPRHLVPGTSSELLGEAEGLSFEGQELVGEDISGGSFVECSLQNLYVMDSDLSAVTIAETWIRGLNAPHLSAPRSSWRDVLLTGSRIGAADLYDGVLDSVHIQGSKLDLVNLRGAKLSDVVFENCTIGELDLAGCSTKRVQFIGCQVETFAATQASFAHVDLTGAELSRIIGIDSLRGAVISPMQLSELAPSLAEHLGLTVLEDI